jgi:cytochrome b561
LIAIFVLVQAPLGLLIAHVELGAWRDDSYNFHESLGALILGFMLRRLANRFFVGAPRAEPTIAPWQRVVSSSVHGALDAVLWAVRDTTGRCGERRSGESPVCTTRLDRTDSTPACRRAWRGCLAALLRPQ